VRGKCLARRTGRWSELLSRHGTLKRPAGTWDKSTDFPGFPLHRLQNILAKIRLLLGRPGTQGFSEVAGFIGEVISVSGCTCHPSRKELESARVRIFSCR
jgi:hypothetical protein